MNYDVWGPWSPTVGPNAPLDDTCAPDGVGSAVSAVKAWTAAGFPASQILLGVASYGHAFHVSNTAATPSGSGNNTLALYAQFDAAQQPAGDKWDSTADGGVDQCGNPNAVGGVFDYWGLIDGGFLNTDGTVAQGIEFTFDNCSQTVCKGHLLHRLTPDNVPIRQPFVYNPTSQVMVSYDDPMSFSASSTILAFLKLTMVVAAKGEFIIDMGLAGFAMWEAGGDSNDMLLDAIENGMGIDPDQCLN